MLVFLILYPALYYYSRKPQRYGTLNRLRYVLAIVSSTLVGFFYRYTFEQQIDQSKPYVVCPNHTSNLDITIISGLMETKYAFLGKEELLGNPVTRLFFKTIDITINRDSKISAFRAFKRAQEYAKQGMSLVIFPEGKIDENYPPVLQEFKNGPFRLAIEQGLPIIPVTIFDAWPKLWDDGTKYGTKPGIVHIHVHKAIETTGLGVEDIEELKNTVHTIIKNELAKYENR